MPIWILTLLEKPFFKWCAGLPRWVWELLAIVVLCLLVWIWYERQISEADEAGYNRAVAECQKAAQEAANKAKAEHIDTQAAIDTATVKDNAAAHERSQAITARTDALTVSIDDYARTHPASVPCALDAAGLRLANQAIGRRP